MRVDKYQHEKGLRPEMERRASELHGANVQGLNLRNSASQLELERLPTKYAQDDQQFGLGVALKNENIASARQRRGMDAEEQGRRRKQWSREDTLAAVEDTKRAIAPAFVQGAQTGDWSAMAQAWNASPFGSANPVDAIQQGPNGSVSVIAGGKPIFSGPVREFQVFVSNAIDPTAYFVEIDTRRKAIEDQKYGLGAAGKAGNEPAEIRTTNAIFARLKPQEGEDENARWMRAYSMQAQRAGHAPEQAISGFYEAVMSKALASGVSGERAEAMALKATRAYAQRFHPDADLNFDADEEPAPKPAQQGFLSRLLDGGGGGQSSTVVGVHANHAVTAGGQTPATSQGRGRIVAAGIDREGRYGPPGGRVGRLEDGTVVPIQ